MDDYETIKPVNPKDMLKIEFLTNFVSFLSVDISDRQEIAIARDTLIKYNLPTDLLDENGKKLKAFFLTDDGSNTLAFYSSKDNIIRIDRENFNIMPSYGLLHEIFHCSTAICPNSLNLCGCISYENGYRCHESLNEGITELFTLLSMPDYEPMYMVQAFFASYLAKIYGMEIFKEHFKGNSKKFFASFGEDEKHIRFLSKNLDEYFFACMPEKRQKKIMISPVDALFNAYNCIEHLLYIKKMNVDEFSDDYDMVLCGLNDISIKRNKELRRIVKSRKAGY